jgi:hypothetical protein
MLGQLGRVRGALDDCSILGLSLRSDMFLVNRSMRLALMVCELVVWKSEES